jgi:drug/metabolite transporter (DMT)-like permease
MILSTRLRDWALLLICNLIWASQFVMVKLVQEQMGPTFAAFFPMTIATLLLIPIVRREGPLRPPRRDWIHFVLLGVLGQVVAQLFITWGVRLSLASNAALISLALPVMTAVMAYFLLGERMSRIRWISFALAIAGVMTCSGVDWKELNLTDARFLLGNLMIFASINGSAFYNTYSKRILTRYSPLSVLLYSYYAVFAFMLPVTLRSEPESFLRLPEFTPTVWVGLAILAFFQYFLSMVIFLNVLTRLDATQAGLCNYLIPFFGVILAWLILRERLTPAMLAGGALVLASTLLVTIYENNQEMDASGSSSESRPSG